LQVHFISHLLPVSSGFHFHTHAFHSLLRVFIAQPTCVTSHQHARHRGHNAVAWRRQPATAHELAPAPDKIGRKGGKGEILWANTCPPVSSRPRWRCVQSLVPIGSEMWICVRYKQTNIHLYI